MCNGANGESHSPGLLRDGGRGDSGDPASPHGATLQRGQYRIGTASAHLACWRMDRGSLGLRLCHLAHRTPGAHPAFLCGPEEATNDPGDGRSVLLPGLHASPVYGDKSPSLTNVGTYDESKGGLCLEGSRRRVVSPVPYRWV